MRDSGGPRGAAGGARADPEEGPGGSQTRVVLVRPDGSRWVAASAKVAQELVAAVNELPSENQWYAEPPAPPLGTGPQLLVLSVTAPDRRLEASLASDGRWWCYLSVIGLRGSEQKLPPPGKLALTDAPARLARILAGARPPGKVADEAPADKQPFEASVEVVWPGQPRAALRPRSQGRPVVQRFATEMRALSPACVLAPRAEPVSVTVRRSPGTDASPRRPGSARRATTCARPPRRRSAGHSASRPSPVSRSTGRPPCRPCHTA